MTREQIEGHIARLSRQLTADDWSDEYLSTLHDSIALWRSRLAHLDGPAEGYERVWITIDVNPRGNVYAYIWPSKEAARADGDTTTTAIVVADIPIRQVPVIVGKVER